MKVMWVEVHEGFVILRYCGGTDEVVCLYEVEEILATTSINGTHSK